MSFLLSSWLFFCCLLIIICSLKALFFWSHAMWTVQGRGPPALYVSLVKGNCVLRLQRKKHALWTPTASITPIISQVNIDCIYLEHLLATRSKQRLIILIWFADYDYSTVIRPLNLHILFRFILIEEIIKCQFECSWHLLILSIR